MSTSPASAASDPTGLHRVLDDAVVLPAGGRSGSTPAASCGPTRCGSASSGSTSTPRRSASSSARTTATATRVRARGARHRRRPRQDAEPRDRLRRHARRHRRGGRPRVPARPRGRRPGRHPGLAHPDPAGHRGRPRRAGTAAASRCPCDGYAILFGRSIAAVLPDDLPAELSLAVMDVCGAPALTAPRGRGVTPTDGAADRRRHRRSRQVRLAQPGRGPRRRRRAAPSASCPHEARGRPAPRRRARRRGRGRRRPRPDRAARRRRRGRRAGRRHRRLRRRPRLRGRRDPGHRRGRHRHLLLDGHLVLAPPRSAPRAWPPTSRCSSATATCPATRRTPCDLLRAHDGVRRLFERRLDDDRPQARPSTRATVREARTLARKVGRPIVTTAPSSTPPSRVERATLRLAGLGGADAEGTPVGQPAARRGPRRRRPRARRRAAGLGRAAPRRGRGPHHPRPEGRRRLGPLPAARGARRAPAPAARRRKAGRRRHHADRPPPRRAGADDRQGRRRPAQAVDLPDRRDRRHLRGHPAGPGGRPRGRRRDRGDPLHRPVAARLRARGRDPRGLRRHLRHPGELPADAGGARRDQRASSAATCGSPTTPPASACPRSPRWPASSGST